MVNRRLPMFLWAILMVVACRSPSREGERPTALSRPAVPTTTATSVALVQPSPTISISPTRPDPTRAAIVARASPVPATATTTPTVPSAEHVNVEQAPYAESECSDKYPCNDDVSAWEARLRVPPNFRASYFARVPGGPTSITFGPDGQLYVAVVAGTIFKVNAQGTSSPMVTGLTVPTGIAFQPGTDKLYVSSRVHDFSVGGEAKISYVLEGGIVDIIDGLPCCYVGMHGPNGIAFGPNGYGYVGVGGRADHGEILEGPGAGTLSALHPWEASILRFSPDGDVVENYAQGFRNPYDIAWDAEGRLYATDNGRDGDRLEDNPPDELHLVTPGGQHGYPWYRCASCFDAPENVEVIAPIYEFLPHSAAAGIVAYLHEHFQGYYNDLFVVLWSAFEGAQKVMRFGPDRSVGSDFATGFAAPIDITFGPDGSLYVADFATGIIFRISYMG